MVWGVSMDVEEPARTAHCFERAREVLSFHASKLWRPASSDHFEFVCGKIWILNDIITAAFKSKLVTDATAEAPSDEKHVKTIKNENDSNICMNTSSSNLGIKYDDRFLKCYDIPIQHSLNDKKIICADKSLVQTIRRKVSNDEQSFPNIPPQIAITYCDPFDPTLFDGLAKTLKFSLIHSKPPKPDRNLYIDKGNVLRLIENHILGYRLFIMVPPLADDSLQGEELSEVKTCFQCDDIEAPSTTNGVLASPEMLLDVPDLPKQLLDKWADCTFHPIWLDYDSHPNIINGPFRQSRCSDHKLLEEMAMSEGNRSPSSTQDSVSDLRSPSQNQSSSISYQSLNTCSRTCTDESNCTSPAASESAKHYSDDDTEEVSTSSSKRNCTYVEAMPSRTSCQSENSAERGRDPHSMNPNAKPFVFSSASSCEERIMADQLLSHNTFGSDERIEDRFCSNFFPIMPSQVNFLTPVKKYQMNATMQSTLNGTTVTHSQSYCAVVAATPHTTNADKNQQQPQSVNSGSTIPTSYHQPIYIPTPTPHIPNQHGSLNQLAPMFVNTMAMPPRCAWLPAQQVLLRPVQPGFHTVNPSGMLHAPILRPSLPQTAQPITPRMMLPPPNQIPMYVMQPPINRIAGYPISNQSAMPNFQLTTQQTVASSYTMANNPNNSMSGARPSMLSQLGPVQAPQLPTPAQCTPTHSAVGNMTTSHSQSQKEMIRSAMELMKARSVSGNA